MKTLRIKKESFKNIYVERQSIANYASLRKADIVNEISHTCVAMKLTIFFYIPLDCNRSSNQTLQRSVYKISYATID